MAVLGGRRSAEWHTCFGFTSFSFCLVVAPPEQAASCSKQRGSTSTTATKHKHPNPKSKSEEPSEWQARTIYSTSDTPCHAADMSARL